MDMDIVENGNSSGQNVNYPVRLNDLLIMSKSLGPRQEKSRRTTRSVPVCVQNDWRVASRRHPFRPN